MAVDKQCHVKCYLEILRLIAGSLILYCILTNFTIVRVVHPVRLVNFFIAERTMGAVSDVHLRVLAILDHIYYS